MRSPGKACWRTIVFQTAEGERCCALPRPEQLAALYRFQNGEALVGVQPVDPRCGALLGDPAEIDWTGFPVVDALEAVMSDELSRLRSLLHTDAAPTPRHGLVWGVDLRGAPDSTPLPPSSEAR